MNKQVYTQQEDSDDIYPAIQEPGKVTISHIETRNVTNNECPIEQKEGKTEVSLITHDESRSKDSNN